MTEAGKAVRLLALALITAAAFAASWMAAPARSGAQAGSMHNCPASGKWSIAVWDGPSGTASGDALATCGAGAVDAAYSLDPQTGAWSRWFAAKPELSTMPPLSDMQGLLALGGTVAAAGDHLAAAQASGQLHNCPPPGKWSIAVWEGPSGTTPADALATCGEGTVGAAYALDPQTGAWSRWFAVKPELRTMAPLSDIQGVIALGAASTATPTPSPSPTPSGPPAPVAGATYVGETSQSLLQEFDVTPDGQGIGRVKFGFEGLLNGEPCVGLVHTTFGRPTPIVDNAFTIDDTDYTLTGRFDSATTASGELQVHRPDLIDDPGCFSEPLAWTASVP